MKKFIKPLLKFAGYKLTHLPGHPILNENPYKGVISRTATKKVIFFDVGVNQGQTIEKMKNASPGAEIYGFEPSEQSFQKIRDKYANQEKINLFNCALGSHLGSLDFNEYSWSAMDSFLNRAYGTAEIRRTYLVEVSTVDEICATNNIPHINLLKTDTEGYELEVLKGARLVFENNKVQFVLVEIFFNENYKDQASFGDIYNFLIKYNFELVRFYDIFYTEEGLASKTDALFLSRSFLK